MSPLQQRLAQQLSQQDEALSVRVSISNTAGVIASMPTTTNQTVVRLGDGSIVPGYDNSASDSQPGKTVGVTISARGANVQTKVGAA